METTYLYSDSNKEMYEHILDQVSKSGCRHTNLVIANKDSNKNESGFLKSHLIECPECQNALRNWEERIAAIRTEIPYKKIDQNELKILSAECYQIVEQSKELAKINREVQKSLDSFSSAFVLKDLFKSFYSLTMLKGLGLAFIVGYLIYLLI
jgi:vacuolar-type H+-ATPase subunit I/STV1